MYYGRGLTLSRGETGSGTRRSRDGPELQASMHLCLSRANLPRASPLSSLTSSRGAGRRAVWRRAGAARPLRPCASSVPSLVADGLYSCRRMPLDLGSDDATSPVASPQQTSGNVRSASRERPRLHVASLATAFLGLQNLRFSMVAQRAPRPKAVGVASRSNAAARQRPKARQPAAHRTHPTFPPPPPTRSQPLSFAAAHCKSVPRATHWHPHPGVCCRSTLPQGG